MPNMVTHKDANGISDPKGKRVDNSGDGCNADTSSVGSKPDCHADYIDDRGDVVPGKWAPAIPPLKSTECTASNCVAHVDVSAS